MLNKIADGKTANYTAVADLKAGGVVVIGEKAGVAVNPIGSGAQGVVDMQGGIYQFKLDSAVSSSVAQGAKVYIPSAGKQSDGDDLVLVDGSGSNACVGYIETPITSGAQVIEVRLK